ncbi:PTS IIA-like nitrogen regulatory protein PtsN [Thalassotalea profundi]|uniref:PTS IIA-like nitrogen-regulatory protein PtsN n=1 Tax=Thalassotalea profundi TaxID=2036687 RepID=A0ABQ3IVF3_9GAMM|nr:PTS IIA-like nitrogen regulatory protein PtsN [Thalassotalea profundi]GHE93170.1 PTS IIA-like nitrogen-regulatory protein PtsN [Thalassotalea profundi]
MKLLELLNLNCTLCAVQATSKKRILEVICDTASTELQDFSTYELLTSLMAREKMGSTGIGNGIAIPHGRLANSNKAVAIVATTEEPIDFDAIDSRPVDVFIALFVPEEQCQEHLATLQNIAQLFTDKQLSKQIRKSTTAQELFELIKHASQ